MLRDTMDNHYNTVEDFATDNRFVSWVLHDDHESGAYWQQYFRDHPDVRPVAARARTLVLNLVRTQKHLNRGKQLDRLWANIDARTRVDDGATDPPTEHAGVRAPVEHNARPIGTSVDEPNENDAVIDGRPIRTYLMVASSVLGLLVVAGVLWTRAPHGVQPAVAVGPAPKGAYVERINDTGRPDTVHLSDGTHLVLENRSRLSYKKSYEDDALREVFLEGEAYFAVAKNPSQPFLVHANEVVTRVLGTSFRVKAYSDDRNILVAVTEGKVSVYSTRTPDEEPSARQDVKGVVLTSNQQVIYTRRDNAFSKSLVEAPAPVHALPDNNAFSYKNSNMSEVFGKLQEAYEVEILFPKEAMENCYLSVTLKDEPLLEKLSIICKTIGASYELIDGKIVIDSKGCP